MIGNFSFEEHDRYFTRMYNHLKFIDRTLDDATIINVIKSKVMIEQELENIMYNLNIKNISNTPKVKDFKIWSAKYDSYDSEDENNDSNSEDENNDSNSEDESEAQSEDESEVQSEDEIDSEAQSYNEDSEDESEAQSEDEIDSDDQINSEDVYIFNKYYNENNEVQSNSDIPNIPEDY